MLKELEKRVRDFHKAGDLPAPDKLTERDWSDAELRMKLLKEEFNEYMVSEYQNDMVNLAKELADIIYVAVGTAVAYGIPISKVMAAVCDNNDSKIVDGKVIKNIHGKIVKPDSYQPLNMYRVLEEELEEYENGSP